MGRLTEDGGVKSAEFVRTYGTLSDREMKAQAISALGRRSRWEDDRATERLMEIGRNEADADLHGEPISCLGHVEDERAFKVLEEIVNQ